MHLNLIILLLVFGYIAWIVLNWAMWKRPGAKHYPVFPSPEIADKVFTTGRNASQEFSKMSALEKIKVAIGVYIAAILTLIILFLVGSQKEMGVIPVSIEAVSGNIPVAIAAPLSTAGSVCANPCGY